MTAEILKASDLSIAAYHSASDFTSSSKLPDIRPCPAVYHAKHIAKTVPRENKDEYDFGNAFHHRILEGEQAYNERCIVRPDTYMGRESAKKDAPMVEKPWTLQSNTCKEWMRGAAGKLVLSSDDVKKVERMMHAIGANPDAMALLSGGESETTFRLKFSKYGIQARHDKWHPEGVTLPSTGAKTGMLIVDLKTCENIERFIKDYYEFGYFYRAAFYQLVTMETLAAVWGVSLDELPVPDFKFVAVEKTGLVKGGPLRCEVFSPFEDDLELGMESVHRDLATLRKCHETGIWQSSRLGIQTIKLKPWQIREETGTEN